MVYSLEEIKRIITPIIKQYSIPAIFLFGSYARGEADINSDLDFLVDTTGTELNSLLKLGALYCDLEAAFGKRIDLITVRSLMQDSNMPSDIDFRNTILKERVQLGSDESNEKPCGTQLWQNGPSYHLGDSNNRCPCFAELLRRPIE